MKICKCKFIKKHDGIIYMAQRIHEMLYHYSESIYKVPVYNTHFLIKEYINTEKLVQQGVINKSHLDNILSEFKKSIKKDIVIKQYITDENISKYINKLDTSSNEVKIKLMKYLWSITYKYSFWCKEYLFKIAKNEKEKKKIDEVLGCFITELICIGYSPEYIFYYNKRVFFESDIEDAENALEIFLDRFDFLNQEFTIYLAIEKKADIFKDVLSKRLEISKIQDDKLLKMKYNKGKYSAYKMIVKGMDEREACTRAYKQLNVFFKFYKFIGNRKDTWFFKKAMIVDKDEKVSFVDLLPQGISSSEDFDSMTIKDASDNIISNILRNAREEIIKIDKAIDLHNIAIQNDDLKSGFLNLWSILEVICLSDHEENKIKEIQHKLLPILQKDYYNTIFLELNVDLKTNINKKIYKEILSSLDVNVDDMHKLMCIILLDDFKEKRDKICSELTELPLLRSRIYMLNEKYKNKKGIKSDLGRYSERIEWHLYRLYRTRNAIIHAGEQPSNLKSLGEHLHEYIDSLLLEVTAKLAHNKTYSNIDNILIENQFIYEDVINLLNQDTKMDIRDIEKLYSIWH